MFTKPETQLKLLLSIVSLGVLGDVTLRVFPWGLNSSLWFTLVLVLYWVFRRGISERPPTAVSWLLGAALVFSLCLSWRDAAALKLVNVFVILVSLVLAVAVSSKRSIRDVWLTAYLGAAFAALEATLMLPFRAGPGFKDSVRAREESTSVPILALLRGLLLASPLAFLFGSLFFSADAIFEQLVTDTFHFDIPTAFGHVFMTCLWTWLAAAIVVLTLAGHKKPPPVPSARQITLGAIEVNVILTVINLLFLSFVVIQFQYFFGAHERVLNEEALTYADYARRGFFELASVATLALVLLLTCARIMHESSPAGKRLFAHLGIALVLLVVVILASSLHRMSIYIDVYGLTRLRTYTGVFSLWLGIVYCWLVVTLVRDRPRDFAFGFLISGYAAAFMLQAINPDALITRVNFERHHAGKSFDRHYALSLSTDAVPTLVEELPTLSPYLQRETAPTFERKWTMDKIDSDLRTWSWSRHRAAQAVRNAD